MVFIDMLFNAIYGAVAAADFKDGDLLWGWIFVVTSVLSSIQTAIKYTER